MLTQQYISNKESDKDTRTTFENVIEAIDSVTAKGMSENLFTEITQSEIIESIFNCGIIDPRDRKHIFFNGWLDVKKYYAKLGITVSYDKSATEKYIPDAIFTFSLNGATK